MGGAAGFACSAFTGGAARSCAWSRRLPTNTASIRHGANRNDSVKLPGHVKSLVTDARLVEERRGQILRAAVKLFSDEGYYTTTISQIAREAGVSTGLIYQYFGDKDDILFFRSSWCLRPTRRKSRRALKASGTRSNGLFLKLYSGNNQTL